MRYLFVILGMYLLTISCLACSDTQECGNLAQVTVSTVSDHQTHAHEQEGCSPFCTCSCCAVSFICAVPLDQQGKPHMPDGQHLAAYMADPVIGAHHAVWQPPRC